MRDILNKYNMTIGEFAEFFGIPRRTVENWVYGVRSCPEYVRDLMLYKLERECPPFPPVRGQ